MLCWNVAGWGEGGGSGKNRSVEDDDFWGKAILTSIACLVEL